MTSDQADPRADQLDRVLARGRTHFILLRGVLFWGVSTALLSSLIMALLDQAPVGVFLPISLILFPIGGYFWGAFMWRFMEQQQDELRRGESV